MTDAQIGYLLIGAVVAILLLKRWRSSGWTPPVWRPQTFYETRIEVFEIVRPVVIEPKPRRKVWWGVIFVAAVVLVALLSQ